MDNPNKICDKVIPNQIEKEDYTMHTTYIFEI